MRLKSLLFIAILAAGFQSKAQTWVEDSVEMGAGYASDIFYNLENGAKKVQPGNDWDLGFQIYKFYEPSFAATVRANNTRSKVAVYSMHMAADATSFAAFSASDTVGKTAVNLQYVNDDTSWASGAFYRNKGVDPFDYGWGKYDPTSHYVNGDSLYLVKVNNVAYKVWIQQYISLTDTIGYKFRIATLDNATDNSVYLKRKPNFEDRLFAYYHIATNTVLDREPSRSAWDILFTQYARVNASGAPIFGQNPNSPQAYTGILSNLYTEVAQVDNVDPDTVNYLNHLGGLNSQVDQIGDDWKTLNMTTFTYDLKPVTYFIKSANSAKYYQIKFTRFDGTTTGKIVFAKRELAPTAVNDVANNVSTYAIVPNPAVSDVNFMVDVKEATQGAHLVVTDLTGKVMVNRSVDIKAGMNAFGFNTSAYASGTYIVTLGNGTWKVAEKLIVQH